MNLRSAFGSLSAVLAMSITVPAIAFDSAHWIEVRGGDWRPDQALLQRIDSLLLPAVVQAASGRGPVKDWNSYRFQYQGRRRFSGQRYIEINAFCREGGISDQWLHSRWVKVYDGGACYFSGKFDPVANQLYDLKVNGVA